MKFSILVLASLSATFASAAMEVAVPDSLRGLRGTDDNGRDLLAVKNFGDYFAVVGDGRCKDSANESYDAVKIKYGTVENPLFQDCVSECLSSKQCNKVVGIQDHVKPYEKYCRCLYEAQSIAGTHLEEGAIMNRRGTGPVNYADGSDKAIKCYRKRDDACEEFEAGKAFYMSVYVRDLGVGAASYHFKGPGDAYISYEENPEGWLLDNGSRLPPKKKFQAAEFDANARKFTGTVIWPAPGLFEGDLVEQYEMVFSEDFSEISGGLIKYFDGTGSFYDTSFFGSDLVYTKILRSNETGEGPWPSCVGETGEWCEEHISALNSELKVKLIRAGMMVGGSPREDRVRVSLDKNGIVKDIPERG